MKKNLLVLSLLWISIQAPVVYSEPFECTKELSASQGAEMLKDVQSTYSGIQTLQAEFFQESYLFALDQSEHSRGQMWFDKPGKTRWHYLQPEEQMFVLNDQTVWFYQPEQKQAMIDSVSRIFITELPVAFLMGMGNLSTDFKLISSCSTTQGLRFELTPASDDAQQESELERFYLLASNQTKLPIGVRIFDVGGNTTSILLEQVKTGVEIDAARFELEIPPNVDLDDRRSKE